MQVTPTDGTTRFDQWALSVFNWCCFSTTTVVEQPDSEHAKAVD